MSARLCLASIGVVWAAELLHPLSFRGTQPSPHQHSFCLSQGASFFSWTKYTYVGEWKVLPMPTYIYERDTGLASSFPVSFLGIIYLDQVPPTILASNGPKLLPKDTEQGVLFFFLACCWQEFSSTLVCCAPIEPSLSLQSTATSLPFMLRVPSTVEL